MAEYKSDLLDIEFNLFEDLKIHEVKEGHDRETMRDILHQYDKFTENELFPTREESDEKGVELTETGVKVPECFQKPKQLFYDNGWFGLPYDEEYGGMAVPYSLYSTCLSLTCAGNVSFSMYPGLTANALNCLIECGQKEHVTLCAENMITGKWGGTMCLTEAGAGSDVGALTTMATPSGDGKYKIKGVKIFISSGDSDLYENIIHLVLARTPNAPEGTRGISLFLVPKNKIDSGASNDVECTKVEEKMGLHGQATCELAFGQNDDCEGWIVGAEYEGMKNMFIMMNESRLQCGIQAEGQANIVTMLTQQYINERAQFGTEIKNHADVKRVFLKMRAMSRGLRALILYTSHLFDLNKVEKDKYSDEIGLLTPICKAYVSDEGYQVCIDAIQLHGGYGYCREYGIEQYSRDTKITTIYEGTNGIQAIDFVGRKILKEKAKTFLAMGAKVSETLKKETARSFNDERRLMIEGQFLAEDILKKFGVLAQNGKMDEVFEHATDFLSFSGNIAIAWRLLEQACLAQDKLGQTTTEEEKEFLEGKVLDFKVFCQHYLVRNIAIAKSILGFDHSIVGTKL